MSSSHAATIACAFAIFLTALSYAWLGRWLPE
jgi:hypothetical protein